MGNNQSNTIDSNHSSWISSSNQSGTISRTNIRRRTIVDDGSHLPMDGYGINTNNKNDFDNNSIHFIVEFFLSVVVLVLFQATRKSKRKRQVVGSSLSVSLLILVISNSPFFISLINSKIGGTIKLSH